MMSALIMDRIPLTRLTLRHFQSSTHGGDPLHGSSESFETSALTLCPAPYFQLHLRSPSKILCLVHMGLYCAKDIISEDPFPSEPTESGNANTAMNMT